MTRPTSTVCYPPASTYIKRVDTIVAGMMFGLGVFVPLAIFRNIIPVTSGVMATALIGGTWLLGAAVVVCMRYLVRHTYLEISPEHVRFHTPGIDVSTTWSNVVRIRPDDSRLMFHHYPLVRGPLTRTYRRHTYGIPLELFDWGEETELGQRLRAYAPHLFATTYLHEPSTFEK